MYCYLWRVSFISLSIDLPFYSLSKQLNTDKKIHFIRNSLDPVQLTQMAKYLETVYVSGWQCSSTASSSLEPGPDLAGKFPSQPPLSPHHWNAHLPINSNRLSIQHRPQQSRPTLHSPTLPRSQTTIHPLRRFGQWPRPRRED